MSDAQRRALNIGDGRYSVSQCGEVFSKGKKMSPQANRKGYLAVGLVHGGKKITRSVASLVAEAFIGPRPIGYQVAHCDGNKVNNNDWNLAYKTQSENEADKKLHGTVALGVAHHSAKLTPKDVIWIRQVYLPRSREFGLRPLARRFGMSNGSIREVVIGKTWPAASLYQETIND